MKAARTVKPGIKGILFMHGDYLEKSRTIDGDDCVCSY